LRLDTAPDSWGVWFPDDPKQVPWHRFLHEAAAASYTAVDLVTRAERYRVDYNPVRAHDALSLNRHGFDAASF
jgi:hypothetical protein